MTTTIGPNTHIEGRVEGDADLDVAGSIQGNVSISQRLAVLESGFVKGDVEAAEVVIEGAFEGTLKVSGLLRLAPSANVKATIETGALILEDGAALSGDVTMDVDGDVPRKTTPARSATPATSSSSSSRKPAPATSSSKASPSNSSSGSAAQAAPASSSTTTTTVEDEPEAEADSAGEDQPTADDLTAAMMEEQTVKELRERLRDLDLPVSGTKQELIERLQEAGAD